jgi:hypothetical protein
MRKWLDWFRPYPELKTVIVNMKQQETVFRGVVWKLTGPFVVLRNVVQLSNHAGREGTRLDGEVLVLLADVDFIQVL